MKIWIVIVAVGVLNYLSRLSFIAFFANRQMPPLLARALKFVPAAMLTALVVPMVVASPVSGTGVNGRQARASSAAPKDTSKRSHQMLTLVKSDGSTSAGTV